MRILLKRKQEVIFFMEKIKEYLLRLTYAKGISSQGKWQILQYLLANPEVRLTIEEICKIASITIHRELFRQSWLEVENHWETIKQNQQYITCLDPCYPSQLLNLTYPPILLFYRGDLSLLTYKMVSVVGGRRSSVLAKKTVLQLLRPVIAEGYVIVSGCAKGIDTYSHCAAIKEGGRTIAVVGTGLEKFYPRENEQLQRKIAEEHLLLSEYPPEAGPRRHRFPMRNRIIAALSLGTFVIEARKKSGSLITAQQALDLGKAVFAVPGNVLTEHSEGCHHLIQDGAICTISGQDILAELKE